MTPRRISVIGPGAGGTTPRHLEIAEEVGRLLAAEGAHVICGGLGGIMEAACRGAFEAGGTTIGILPGHNDDGNDYLSVMLPTGLGELRGGLVVQAGHAAICIGGSWGTLSEVALTLRSGRTCVGIETWDVVGDDMVIGGGIVAASHAREAVELALRAADIWRSP